MMRDSVTEEQTANSKTLGWVEEKKPSVSNQNNRILYIDVLRVLSITAVLVAHAVSSDVSNIAGGKVDSSQWWVANIIDSSIRWCIPIFFMISGILLLDPKKEESYSTFLKKRFSRIGIPFLIWGVFYSYLKHLILEPDGITFYQMPKVCLKDILTNNIYYHMWFMYTIMAIYLFVPIIRTAIKKFTRKEILIFIGLWFLTSIVYQSLQDFYHLFSGKDINIALFTSPYISGYMGFCVLGYYLDGMVIKRFMRFLVYLLGIAGGIAIPILLYISNMGTDTLDETFYNYLTLPIFLFSVGVFMFIRNIDWERKLSDRMKRIVLSLSEASFGIYLVHLFFEDVWIEKFSIWNNMPIVPKAIGISIITYTLSFIFVKILSANKFVKKIMFG